VRLADVTAFGPGNRLLVAILLYYNYSLGPGNNRIFRHGAPHHEGRRGISAHRSNDELQAHRRRTGNLRIHGSQAPREYSAKAGLSDHGSIDRACDCHRAQLIRFERPVHAFSAELRPREVEIVQLVCGGLTSKEIARRLRISPLTVRKHRENAMRKLGVHSMAALIDVATTLGVAGTLSGLYRAKET
jgi:DNA-binding CsgD family transcriptional regulator